MKMNILFGAGAVFLSSAAVAHHSVPAFYELGNMTTLTGSIEEFRFVNPHSILKIKVTRPDGTVELWRAESSPVAWMVRNGLRPTMFPRGLRVTVTGNVARDRSVKIVRLLTIKMPNGRVFNTNTGREN
jgi:Family of unknown function (DUF6152)